MRDLQISNTDGRPFKIKPMDIEYDGNGQVIFVDNVQMIDQMLKKALLTTFGSNRVRPLYGAAFNSLIGAKLDSATSALMMTTEAERVVNRVAVFTQQNLNFTAEQRIAALQDILINRGKDQRNVELTIEIVTESGQSKSLQTQLVTNPI